jgi:hypothetical protein
VPSIAITGLELRVGMPAIQCGARNKSEEPNAARIKHRTTSAAYKKEMSRISFPKSEEPERHPGLFCISASGFL